MKVGIISDVHANLEALTVVLGELDKNKVDEIICLGDLVGYGPDPNTCVHLVRRNCATVLAGNHDYATAGFLDTHDFNKNAKLAVEWTRQNITKENLEYIKSLPMDSSKYDCYFVHAAPENPKEWYYIIDSMDAQASFQYFDEQVCFLGHSHVPVIFYETATGILATNGPRIELEEDKRYLINVGSVGQPRDRNPDSAFGIFDTESRIFELKRAAYHFEKTQDKIFSTNLPDFLATRLAIGY